MHEDDSSPNEYDQKQEWYPVTEEVRMMLSIVASTGNQFLSDTDKSASNDAWTTTIGLKKAFVLNKMLPNLPWCCVLVLFPAPHSLLASLKIMRMSSVT